jgi:predicted enzyme related to lactoylglutathione lyase
MEIKSLAPNIGVNSVDETVEFYTKVLGFKEMVNVPGEGKLIWAMVNAGNTNFMFQDRNSLEEEYPELKGRSLQSVLSFYIKVKDKNLLYDKLRNTDYLAKEMNTTPYGAEEFAIRDNNGFILTITEDVTENTSVINYDNFFLPADDYALSKQFYSETLGLKTKFEFAEQGMVAFCVGDEEPAIILKDKKKFPSATPTVWLKVSDVRTLHQEMKAKGISFLTDPFKIRTGWAVEFRDPSGNILGFTDYLNE